MPKPIGFTGLTRSGELQAGLDGIGKSTPDDDVRLGFVVASECIVRSRMMQNSDLRDGWRTLVIEVLQHAFSNNRIRTVHDFFDVRS